MFSWLKSSKVQKQKTLGQLGEEFAQREYKNRGFKIIAANFFNPKGLRLGEIDFVATNKEKIVFVEVKTRSNKISKFGTAEEAVNYFKQSKLLKAAKVFLAQNKEFLNLTPQIDVCVVEQSPVDNNLVCAKIIANAVEDWN